MRPISSLTAAAGEIASTRDPSRRVPQPETDDEVAELARTLDQMLRALDEARSETQQMVIAQREFVADASHELRTPLTSILANLELLEVSLSREQEGQDERGEMIDSALRSSRRMSRLVSDLLLLARADAGRSAPRRRVELPEIAGAAVAEAMPVADRHPISADMSDSAEVIGNPDELHRMVANLIDNAMRHTPEGTPIHIKVGTDDGSAVVEVTDEGPGLPGALGDQIFERFVRGSGPADLSRNAGSGLGLAIVHAVATSHGGTVVAGSSPSGGARFTVRVPLASDAEKTPRQDAVDAERRA
jgi:two-component system, OmpR family, sensor kinase